ncbi:DMT family transporter [Streptomyces sedi]
MSSLTARHRTTARMALLALLWGSAFLWIDVCLDHGLSPAQIAFGRCLLGAAVLWVAARVAGQALPSSAAVWGRLLVAALFCNALPFLLFGLGQRTVDSGVAGVIHATTPLWSLLLGLALGAERRLGGARLGGLLLGLAGTALLFAPWRGAGGLMGWGALALLGAAVSYALAFAYMARRLTGTGTGPLALSAAQLTAATALSAPGLLTGGAAAGQGPDATGLWALLVLGTLGTGVTFLLNFRLIADEGPTTAATVGYLLPVVSLGLGAWLLAEPLSPRVVLGMAVVLAGVGLTRAASGNIGTAVDAKPAIMAPSTGDRPGDEVRRKIPERLRAPIASRSCRWRS